MAVENRIGPVQVRLVNRFVLGLPRLDEVYERLATSSPLDLSEQRALYRKRLRSIDSDKLFKSRFHFVVKVQRRL